MVIILTQKPKQIAWLERAHLVLLETVKNNMKKNFFKTLRLVHMIFTNHRSIEKIAVANAASLEESIEKSQRIVVFFVSSEYVFFSTDERHSFKDCVEA